MESLSSFIRVVDGIYGVYLDSVQGFALNKRLILDGQNQTVRDLANTHPDQANIEYLDSAPIYFSRSDPTDPEAVIQHQCNQKHYKERNGKNGLNHLIISRMCVVNIYEYWEIYFRNEIAKDLGIKRSTLKDPVMGDLRLFRHSMIHHDGIALPEIKNCEILKWFSNGEEIIIDDDKMDEIIREIKSIEKRIVVYR